MLIYSLVLVYTQTGVKLHKAVLLYKKRTVLWCLLSYIFYTQKGDSTQRDVLHFATMINPSRVPRELASGLDTSEGVA